MLYPHFAKRLFDLLLSVTAAIILSPLIVIVGFAIKLVDPGPVFFVQERIGRGGETFKFYKFRSMPIGTSNEPSDELGEVKISWIGRLIRRTNIDELPQLLNIILADMSLVGPRPPLQSQKELLDLRRTNGAIWCRPGLTGLAQVNAFDGMSVNEKARFDGEYAESLSFLVDLKIILQTITYLFRRPPVY